MTSLAVTPTPTAADVDGLDHFACCDDDETIGASGPALCGTITTYDAEAVDEVSCIVCSDLDVHDYCPRHGHCPWGKT